MKITVIGTSAGIGLETVNRALQWNHEARSAIPLPDSKGLKCLMGSATEKADLSKALQDSDAVIVALGTGKNMKATTLFSDFASAGAKGK